VAEKTIEEVRKFILMVAAKQGWLPTRDESFLEDLAEGLRVNWNRYGYFLCPCRDSEGSREADADVLCPCVYARQDIETYGYCFCSLYWSSAFASSGGVPGGIPERRGRGPTPS